MTEAPAARSAAPDVIAASPAALRLQERTVLITGAASGIGMAIARRAIAEGANVVLCEHDDMEARNLARDFGNAALGIGCDVTNAGSVEAAVDGTVAHFGRLDGLVHNAAAPSVDATVVEVDPRQWHKELDVSLTGAFLLGKYAVPTMAMVGGSIVFIASQYGSVGTIRSVAYCSAKAGLVNLAKAMAADHAAQRIRVNSLSPGPVATSRLLQRWPDIAAANAALGPATLLGRIARPGEIAAAVAFLLSDDASYITGTDLLVDGGFTAR